MLSAWQVFELLVRCVAVMAGGHRVIIFGFVPQNARMRAVAVAFSMAWAEGGAGGDGDDRALSRLAGFRGEFFRCLTRRG